MKEIELEIAFATPSFLGNATQQSQWRTPPFKALLRHWWRVVKAKDVGYDYKKLLEEENKLFGKAAEENATKSALRIRLNKWTMGKLTALPSSAKVRHPEVKSGTMPIDPALYLGYGPVSTKGCKLAIEPIIDTAKFWIGFPDQFQDEIQKTIQLISWFGTIGSRSRNSWGSVLVNDLSGIAVKSITANGLEKFCRSFEDCLKLQWPHAIGKDQKAPLVWLTETRNSWSEVIKDLAEAKIKFRTEFIFNGGGFHPETQNRHIISYPITKHSLNGLGNQSRLANQIRFKVQKMEDNRYFGLIFHLPCAAPEDQFIEKLTPQNKQKFREFEKAVWPRIHKMLNDNATRLK
ncbi:MAG: hypothetical protein EOM80_07495 [Erysipelotrichia bacterium]|nr:hypothetical protein [Erysipelotrichia bacterium]